MAKKDLAKRSAFLEKVKGAKTQSLAPSKKAALESALNIERIPLLLFAMDATASREPSWAIAQQITGRMFEQIPSTLKVALAYHRGGSVTELTPFTENAKAFQDKVASVTCAMGVTALNQILSKAASIKGLRALIYCGDCFEEDEATAYSLARQLALTGVKTFFFHDNSSAAHGYNTTHARHVFSKIVEITGGAVLDFHGQNPQETGDLLQAVAVYASAGKKALEARKLALPGAKPLLDSMS